MSNEKQYPFIVKLELTPSNFIDLSGISPDEPIPVEAKVVDVYSASPQMTPLHRIKIADNEVIAYISDDDYWVAKIGELVTAEFHRTHCSIRSI